jgi:type IV pilus assembly protein PilW
MSYSKARISSAAGKVQRGFTMVELMVSITVALFLLGGVFASLQSTRSAFRNQSALAQMQDNERLAMNLIAELVESAGYYPSPYIYDASTVLPGTVAPFTLGGQGVFGTYGGGAAPGDTLTVRFGAAAPVGAVSDNAMNCLGGTNTAVAPYDVFVNRFHVDAATNALWCQATTAAGVKDVLIVNGIQNMTVLFGVTRSGGSTGSCTDTYLRPDQMGAGDWANVCSVRVTLTFTNTLNSVNAAANPVVISRTIAVMNELGVNS